MPCSPGASTVGEWTLTPSTPHPPGAGRGPGLRRRRFFLGVTVAALLARDISGRESLGGVPLAFAVLAGALAAAPIGAWMGRVGRRVGLAAGHLAAAAGAALVVLAAAGENFPFLCLGMAGFGLGNTSNLLARFAATDLAPAAQRARAISVVLLATAAGAIAGPNLASLTKPIAKTLGVLESAGPFAVAVLAYLMAAGVLLTLLRPDPLLASAPTPIKRLARRRDGPAP